MGEHLKASKRSGNPPATTGVERISPGWDGNGFPAFRFESHRLLKCIDCFADGGDVYIIISSDSVEARGLILEAMRERRSPQITEGDAFSPPSSWCVETLPMEPTVLASWVGGTTITPDLRTLAEMAKKIHEEGAIEKGCDKCHYTFPEPWSRMALHWDDGGVGDSFTWRCPECGHINWLSSDNF